MTTKTSTGVATSRDGTRIGYWTTGAGRPLVLVHGGTADHTRWRPVLPLLEPYCTVVAMDRRGRGGSADAADYSIEREFEDVSAVVDTVAEASGGPVDLLGHSFGGVCALGAATLTTNVHRLLLYEPADPPDEGGRFADLVGRLERLLDAGERDEMLRTFFREAVHMPEHELDRLRSLPAWQGRVAAAHTLPRELRAVGNGTPVDEQRVRAITVPTLLLLGGDSPDAVKAATAAIAEMLPDASVVVLEGQQHVAIDTAPALFADHALGFLRAGS